MDPGLTGDAIWPLVQPAGGCGLADDLPAYHDDGWEPARRSGMFACCEAPGTAAPAKGIDAMANYALLTAVGRDRPGIAAGVANVLYQAGCNIEDSEMALLGGQFAIMLLLRLPEGLTSEQLEERFSAVKQELGLWLRLTDIRPEEAGEPKPDRPRHVIHVYGADKPGIVARITSRLAERSVNITNLHTEVVPHDVPLYIMIIEVDIPPFVDEGQLRAELEQIARQIGVELTLKPKPDARF